MNLLIYFTITGLIYGLPVVYGENNNIGESTNPNLESPREIEERRVRCENEENISFSSEDNPKWIKIPAGPYSFGKSNLILTDLDYDYFIMKYEVTNAQYRSFLSSGKADGIIFAKGDNSVFGYYSGDMHWNSGIRELLDIDDKDCRIKFSQGVFTVDEGFENHPVVEVTWFGANAFSEYYNWKLPTEKAWEKAARGANGRPYPWGWDEPSCLLANSSGCQNSTWPVGQGHGMSPFGVEDLSGNVAEWTRSFHSTNSSVFVIRGGAWDGFNGNLLSYRRDVETPTESTRALGFRCIKLK